MDILDKFEAARDKLKRDKSDALKILAVFPKDRPSRTKLLKVRGKQFLLWYGLPLSIFLAFSLWTWVNNPSAFWRAENPAIEREKERERSSELEKRRDEDREAQNPKNVLTPIDYTIVVSYLDGDDDQRTSYLTLLKTLEKNFPFVKIQAAGETIKRISSSPGVDDPKQSQKLADTVLKKYRAHLLIWGQVIGSNVALYFSTQVPVKADGRLELMNLYAFDDLPLTLGLQKDFLSILEPVVITELIRSQRDAEMSFEQFRRITDRVIVATNALESNTAGSRYKPLLRMVRAFAFGERGIRSSNSTDLKKADKELEQLQAAPVDGTVQKSAHLVAQMRGQVLSYLAQIPGNSDARNEAQKQFEKAIDESISIDPKRTDLGLIKFELVKLQYQDYLKSGSDFDYNHIKKTLAEIIAEGKVSANNSMLLNATLLTAVLSSNRFAKSANGDDRTASIKHAAQAIEIWHAGPKVARAELLLRFNVAVVLSKAGNASRSDALVASDCGLRASGGNLASAASLFGPSSVLIAAQSLGELHLMRARSTQSMADVNSAIANFSIAQGGLVSTDVPPDVNLNVLLGLSRSLFLGAVLTGNVTRHQEAKNILFLIRKLPLNDAASSVVSNSEVQFSALWEKVRRMPSGQARMDFKFVDEMPFDQETYTEVTRLCKTIRQRL